MRRSGILLFVLALTPFAGAAQYCVTPDGSDADPGTIEQPWKTLTMANRTVEPGDTVYVRGGVYREQLRPERSGEPGKYITYRAVVGETPVITDFYPGNQAAIDLTTRSYIRIDGIHVDGRHLKYPADPAKKPTVWRWVWMAKGAHHNIVQNCNFRFADSWDGFLIEADAHHNKVLNNRMDGVGSWDSWNNSKGGQRALAAT